MPPKKRPHVNEFDLEFNERKVVEQRQQQENMKAEHRKSQQHLSELMDAASLGPEATADELLAFELVKVGDLKKIILAVQLVRDVGHLGRAALATACRAVTQRRFRARVPRHDTFKYTTSKVTCFDLAKKTSCLVLRAYCRKCKVTFGPWAADKAKSQKKKKKGKGKRTYYTDDNVSFIEVNERNFIHKSMMELFVCLIHHTWASFQSFSEAFTEALYNIALRSGVELIEEDCRLSRKLLSAAFYEYEVWVTFLEQSNSIDMERNLNIDEYIRASSFQERGQYPHDQQTMQCQEKGCDYAHIADGLWKLQYTLCMFQEKITGPLGITYPTNCRDEPISGKAFCMMHCEIMTEQGYPTDLKGIVERLGRTEKDVIIDFYEHLKEANLLREQFPSAEPLMNDELGEADSAPHFERNVPITRSQSRKQLAEEIHKDLMLHATEI
uniref:CxC5 like cysteine cluster associated with KDZ domain-containing protein n=1 Tax=Plectus sambesii TaxID=2011161 RepID=A0A914WKL2_9BILA